MSRIHYVPFEVTSDERNFKTFEIKSPDFNNDMELQTLGVLIIDVMGHTYYFAPGKVFVERGILPPVKVGDFEGYCDKMYSSNMYDDSCKDHTLRLNSLCNKILVDSIKEESIRH